MTMCCVVIAITPAGTWSLACSRQARPRDGRRNPGCSSPRHATAQHQAPGTDVPANAPGHDLTAQIILPPGKLSSADSPVRRVKE